MAKRGNSEGSITFNQSRKRWETKFTFRDPVSKELVRKTFVARTKAEALAKGKRWRQNLEGGLVFEAEKMTLACWIDIWTKEYVRPKGLSPKTVDKYESCLNCYIVPRLGDVPMSQLRPVHFQKLFNQLRVDGGRERKVIVDGEETVRRTGLSSGTIKVTRRYICMALDRAVKDGLLIKNPVKDTDPVKQTTKEASALTKEQAAILVSTAKRQLPVNYVEYMAILLALSTGMRLGEVFGLQWDCVDLERGVVFVRRSLITSIAGMHFKEPKTPTSIRRIPLTDEVLTELEMYKEWQGEYINEVGDRWQDNNLVLPNGFGKAVNTSNFTTRYFKDLLVETGIIRSFKFHELRHTFASFLVQADVNFKVVQELMGHSSITITLNLYSHLAPRAKEEAVARLNGIFSGPNERQPEGGQKVDNRPERQEENTTD